MKTKINKKSYNFTAKQKRKDWHSLRYDTIGKPYKVLANRMFRRENKVILRKTIHLGKEIPFVRHRKYLSWWAW